MKGPAEKVQTMKNLFHFTDFKNNSNGSSEKWKKKTIQAHITR